MMMMQEQGQQCEQSPNEAQHEIESLHPAWRHAVDKYTGRVKFYRKEGSKDDAQTENPTLYALPTPWELRGNVGLFEDETGRMVVDEWFYYNPRTKETRRGPRPGKGKGMGRGRGRVEWGGPSGGVTPDMLVPLGGETPRKGKGHGHGHERGHAGYPPPRPLAGPTPSSGPDSGRKFLASSHFGTPIPLRNSPTAFSIESGTSVLRRRAIGDSPSVLQSQYDILGTIDPGSSAGAPLLPDRARGAKAGEAIGGMNSGVFVVKSRQNSRLFVRKDLSAGSEFLARYMRREVRLTRDLMHCGLVAYVDAAVEGGDERDGGDVWLLLRPENSPPPSTSSFFFSSSPSPAKGRKEPGADKLSSFLNGANPLRATVIMEYCDLGSLGDLTRRLATVRRNAGEERVPEGFVWHAFVALADALAFLRTGRSLGATKSLRKESGMGMGRDGAWKALVHGDVKPDNVFLRSRSGGAAEGTMGEREVKYPYVVLADWGLARSEEGADVEDRVETAGGKNVWALSGSWVFHGPELAFDPYPPANAAQLQAGPHTTKSDVWALAACIFCLCERDNMAHIARSVPRTKQKNMPPPKEFLQGRAAKLQSLDLNDGKEVYSEILQMCIRYAGHPLPEERPGAEELLGELREGSKAWRRGMKEMGVNGGGGARGGDKQVLVKLLPVRVL
ncbi:hypothetical protein MKZ38_002178 [Zalerion maritima]|uniref:non-specific serine/threonine protein kinase n=1 Tax=Zalerion maritima TaxID=339359 RepID=A0AAD5RPB0_9PEZI|nr:hypothetical protein MKZ38_002178 [Zalerion maritima]